MVATTIICAVLYPLYMVLRYHGALDGWTRGFYSLMRDSLNPEQMWGNGDVTGILFFEKHARIIRHEMRWHTGVRKRLSSPIPCLIQWGLAILGFVAAWRTGNPWWLLLPACSVFFTAFLMNIMAWRWLRDSASAFEQKLTASSTDHRLHR